jgi:hypothetical protein
MNYDLTTTGIGIIKFAIAYAIAKHLIDGDLALFLVSSLDLAIAYFTNKK